MFGTVGSDRRLRQAEQPLIVDVLYDFLRQKWPDESGGVNKKAAARALAAADANPGNLELWRTRVRRIVEKLDPPTTLD